MSGRDGPSVLSKEGPVKPGRRRRGYVIQPNDKKKIIREQIILVVDLQPSIHRDVF